MLLLLKNQGFTTELKVVEGMMFDWLCLLLYGDRYGEMEAILEDPYILITDKNQQCP